MVRAMKTKINQGRLTPEEKEIRDRTRREIHDRELLEAIERKWKCENCNAELGERDSWIHRRQGHRITNIYGTELLKARIGELRALQERARVTGQLGAVSLFKGMADALERGK